MDEYSSIGVRAGSGLQGESRTANERARVTTPGDDAKTGA
jgi:hypothetical protein